MFFFLAINQEIRGMGKANGREGHVMKRFIISLTAGDSKVSHLAFFCFRPYVTYRLLIRSV